MRQDALAEARDDRVPRQLNTGANALPDVRPPRGTNGCDPLPVGRVVDVPLEPHRCAVAQTSDQRQQVERGRLGPLLLRQLDQRPPQPSPLLLVVTFDERPTQPEGLSLRARVDAAEVELLDPYGAQQRGRPPPMNRVRAGSARWALEAGDEGPKQLVPPPRDLGSVVELVGRRRSSLNGLVDRIASIAGELARSEDEPVTRRVERDFAWLEVLPPAPLDEVGRGPPALDDVRALCRDPSADDA